MAVQERAAAPGGPSAGEESRAAVTPHPHQGAWAQRLGVALAVTLFVAALCLIIASITAI